jgi:hypothetical protein
MGIASSERSAPEELAAAHLRDAKPDEILELAEDAIDQATAAGDSLTIESVAGELDSAAAAHPDQGEGLRLRFAAERAYAIASQPPVFPASGGVRKPVPVAAKRAFRLTGLLLGVIVMLALFLFGAMAASGSYEIAYLLMFVVVLGSLFAALTGAVGFVRWFQGKRRGD